MLRDYHDARHREEQWRIPQLLLALLTPVMAVVTVVFTVGGAGDSAVAAGAVTVLTAAGAALLAAEVWRWHRTAIGIGNRFREEHPGDLALLVEDPL